MSARLIGQLEVFRQRLLQVDARNPSVFTSKIVKRRNFDVSEHFRGKASKVFLSALRGQGKIAFTGAGIDAATQAVVSEHLRKVDKSATDLEEETGVQNLRLAVCWLEGMVGPRDVVRAPLFLRSASLKREASGKRAWGVDLDGDTDLVLNESLLGALAKNLGWRASDGFQEALLARVDAIVKDKKLDISTVLTEVRAAFLEEGLEFRHTANGPERLQNTTKAVAVAEGFDMSGLSSHPPARGSEVGGGELALRGYMVVGLFHQSSTALFDDYAALTEKARGGEVDQGIVDNLLEVPADAADVLDPAADSSLDSMLAEEVQIALPCDPSQLQVLRDAQSRECTVVRGPPGTGKSQVIANLVFDAMARGERVLVVCQKRAALDVVMSRLQDSGIGDWVQVVHDTVGDRKDVFKRLNNTLELSKRAPRSVSKGKLKATAQNIDHATAQLAQISTALFSEFQGLTVRDMYREAPTVAGDRGTLPSELLALPWAQLNGLLERLELTWRPAAALTGPLFPLCFRTDWAALTSHDLAQIRSGLVVLEENLRPDVRGQTALALTTDHRNFQETLSTYQQLVTKWWRFLSLRWWITRARHRVLVDATGIVSVDEARALEVHAQSVAKGLESLRTRFRSGWIRVIEGSLRSETSDTPSFKAMVDCMDRHQHAVVDLDHQLSELEPWVSDFLSRDRSEVYAGDGLASQGASTFEAWKDQVRGQALLRWISDAEAHHPVLRGAPFEKYRLLQRQLTKYLDEQPALTRTQIRNEVWRKSAERTLPPELKGTRTKPDTAYNKLAHQLGKQRQLYSIRKILSTFSWQIDNLARCWLLSPEVVAEILPLERGLFDLVVFDEASQLPLERALPVLYRGKRIVIAGDEQQMPPSRFFQSIGDEDEGGEDEAEDEARQAESLLDQAKKIYGFRYLTWHYRSKFGELIEFSNRVFYDGTLQVTPSTARSTELPPIQYHHIAGGQWDKQVNLVEARACADLLLDIARRNEQAPRSVAVIAVNAKHQAAIEDVLRQLEDDDPEAARLIHGLRHPASGSRDDALIVKNIENVQGDERDIVVFSTAYGRPPGGGSMRRNFGAISSEGGDKRLNVAFTRSREQMHVLCSFDPNEVVVEGLKHRGPRVLMGYLKYAKAITAGDRVRADAVLAEFGDPRQRPDGEKELQFDSPFEEEVYEALRAQGLELDTQVGVGGYRIDLGVVHPKARDRYILAVECDGATYHSGASVRERDIARQRALETKGWSFIRIWSRDWWKNQQRCVAEVVAEVQRLVDA